METENQVNNKALNINKPAYVIFTLAGLIFLILKDYSQAVIFVSLALVFDPFDVKKPFKERALYQRVWLFVHLAISLSLFAVLVAGKS